MYLQNRRMMMAITVDTPTMSATARGTSSTVLLTSQARSKSRAGGRAITRT